MDSEMGMTEADRADVRASNPSFAAKEAAMKALGTGMGGLGWKDVEVVREDSGAPRLNVTARAKELATSQGVTKWHVSLTHIANMAMAVVVTER
jgi:holo-[acyl-carrier protein] synthase